jgi:hypothetical protein
VAQPAWGAQRAPPDYVPRMKVVLTILVALGMLATLATLFMGILGISGDRKGSERSNLLMRYRVIFQGVTLLLFALLLWVSRG